MASPLDFVSKAPVPPPVDPISIGLNVLKYGPTLKKGWDWLTGGNKKKAPKRTISPLEQQYTNFLQQQSKTGMGQPAMNMMMNQSSRAINPMVNQIQAGNTGRAITQGIEGSGVVAQQNLQANALGVGQMAQTARDIALNNERIKNTAQDKLGRIGVDRTNQNYKAALSNYNADRANTSSLVSDIAGFAGTALENKQMGNAKTEALKKYFPNLSPEQLEALLQLS